MYFYPRPVEFLKDVIVRGIWELKVGNQAIKVTQFKGAESEKHGSQAKFRIFNLVICITKWLPILPFQIIPLK